MRSQRAPLEAFSIIESAKFLHVHPMTIYRLIREGSIRAVKVGANYRVAEEELRRVVREGAKPSRKATRKAAK